MSKRWRTENWKELNNRERDALVAEKVFGATVHEIGRPLPNYTTEIAFAWEIVEYLKNKFYKPTLNWWDKYSDNPEGWHCLFQRDFREGEIFDSWGCSTVQEAICLSALKSVGVK